MINSPFGEKSSKGSEYEIKETNVPYSAESYPSIPYNDVSYTSIPCSDVPSGAKFCRV